MAIIKKLYLLDNFKVLWTNLFISPVHLDSAISKMPKNLKGTLQQMTSTILRRPASISHFLKIDLQKGEPWNLSKEQISEWQTAYWMADRLFKSMKSNPDYKEGAHAFFDDFPPHMIREFKRAVGPDRLKSFINTLTMDPPISIRVRRSVNRNDFLSHWNDTGILPGRGKISRLSPTGIVIQDYTPILSTEEFKKGDFEIQDEGSQFMSYFALWPELLMTVLRKAPNMQTEIPPNFELPADIPFLNVIDACAGAGGKTLAMADAMFGKGRVYAYDTSQKKLDSLRKRAVRAKLNNIQTKLIEEGKENEITKRFQKTADIVLVDAPCSGWGVLRRNPDIKWRQDQSSLTRLPELQLSLLSAYSYLVKPGGRLVFGVCTFREAETRTVVGKFLNQNQNFTGIGGGYLGPSSADGFYMYAFERKK